MALVKGEKLTYLPFKHGVTSVKRLNDTRYYRQGFCLSNRNRTGHIQDGFAGNGDGLGLDRAGKFTTAG